MMQVDISKIERMSHFFAEMVEIQSPLSGLKDGICYVIGQDDALTPSTLSKIKEMLTSYKSRLSWLMECGCELMPADVEISLESPMGILIVEGYNLILPVATADRDSKVYLVGRVTHDSFWEPAVSYLLEDAEEITCTCLLHALLNRGQRMRKRWVDGVVREELEKWVQQVQDEDFMSDKDHVCRGSQAAHAMHAFGVQAVEAEKKFKNGELSYQEGRKKLAELSSTIKKMKSGDELINKKASEDYQIAMAALSDYEKNKLLQKSLLSNKPSDNKRNILEVIDRESMGQDTQLQIILSKREKNRKPYNFQEDWDYWLFVQEKNGHLHPLKMQKTSLAIYVMSLIEKVTQNRKNSIVNIRKNKAAYIEVNRLLFGCSVKDAEKSFKELDLKIDNKSEANRQGNLGKWYSDIEYALQTAFEDIEESYSPFLANRLFPLTLSKEKIQLPEVFLSLIIY